MSWRGIASCWLLVAAIALPSATAVRADPGDVVSVTYAEVPEELVLRWTPPEGLEVQPWSVRLTAEIAWSGEQREIVPALDRGVYEARWDVSDMPVWTELRYQWHGVDAEDGEPVRSVWRTVDRPDPVSRAREWTCNPGTYVDVCTHFADSGFRQAWLDAADAGYLHALEILGETARPHGSRPRVVILANDMLYWMLSGPPESGGRAFPSYGVTLQYVAGNSRMTAGTIPHEIMHLLDPTSERLDVPVWFTEGLAVANELHDHGEERALLTAAQADELLFSWGSMQWRCGMCDQALWYAQAWDMVDAVGLDRAVAIIAATPDITFPAAWLRVMGRDTEAWGERYVRRAGVRWDVITMAAVGSLCAGSLAVRARRRRLQVR